MEPSFFLRGIFGRGLERLENCRLAGQRDFFLALFRAVVCDGKKEAGGRAAGVLVVESGRLAAAAGVFDPPERFRFHLRVCVHLDSLHPQSDDPSAEQKIAGEMSELRRKMRAEIKFLRGVRRETGGYFLGAASVCVVIPYFFKTCC